MAISCLLHSSARFSSCRMYCAHSKTTNSLFAAKHACRGVSTTGMGGGCRQQAVSGWRVCSAHTRTAHVPLDGALCMPCVCAGGPSRMHEARARRPHSARTPGWPPSASQTFPGAHPGPSSTSVQGGGWVGARAAGQRGKGGWAGEASSPIGSRALRPRACAPAWPLHAHGVRWLAAGAPCMRGARRVPLTRASTMRGRLPGTPSVMVPVLTALELRCCSCCSSRSFSAGCMRGGGRGMHALLTVPFTCNDWVLELGLTAGARGMHPLP